MAAAALDASRGSGGVGDSQKHPEPTLFAAGGKYTVDNQRA